MVRSKTMSAKKVAEYFIWKAKEEKKPISNKKLQKLLYYGQAWSLVMRSGKRLFDEKIEAWVHGPAVREVYFDYKKFGFAPIELDIKKADIEKIPNDIKKFLDDIWSAYGKYDAAYLEHLTHSETPWQKARGGLEPGTGSNNEILLEDMREFYTAKLKEVHKRS